MTAYRDLPFSSRMGAMGDKAESVFESLYPNAQRLGLDRPDFSLKNLPDFTRHAPDYIDGNGWAEVIGCGRDGLLKIRLDKIISLSRWAANGPLDLFAFQSNKKRWQRAPWDLWLQVIDQHATWDHFSDNNRCYAALKVEYAPEEWRSL